MNKNEKLYIVSREKGKTVAIDLAILDHHSIVALSMLGKPHRIKEMKQLLNKSSHAFNLLNKSTEIENYIHLRRDSSYKFFSSNKGTLNHTIAFDTNASSELFINWDNKPIVEALTIFLKEKKKLPVSEEIVSSVLKKESQSTQSWRKILSPLTIVTSNPDFQTLTGYTVDDQLFLQVMGTLVFKASQDAFDWSNINTTEDYILQFLEPIKSRILSSTQVLFNKDTLIPDVVLKGKKKPFDGQLPLIASCIEVLKQKKNRFCYLAAQQGTGKTIMSALISMGYFSEKEKKNPCIFALCPATTISQWKEDIKASCSNVFNLNIITIRNTIEFIKLYQKTNLSFDTPTYILCSKETFKLAHEEYAVYQTKTKQLTYETLNSESKKIEETTQILTALFCTDCNQPLYLKADKKGDVFLTENDFKKKNNRNSSCPHCKSSLWSATYKKTKKTSVINFIKKRHIRFDMTIVDEMQESNNSSSQIGEAVNALLRNHTKKALVLSGTPNNGYASSLYNIISAFLPRSLEANNIRSLTDFVETYGTLEAIIKSSDTERDMHGNVLTKKSDFIEVEGINPLVFTQYLSSNFVSATLEDVADSLPDFNELYIPIKPTVELKTAENEIHQALKSKRCVKTMGASILRHYVNNPFNWNPLDLFGDSFSPKNLDEGLLLPKEEELLSIVKKELGEKRKCMIYVEFNDKGGKYMSGTIMPTRIQSILKQHGISSFYLSTSTCKNTERKAVLEKNKDSYDVFITNRSLVSVGLNLQFIESYINYIPSFMVNLVDQSTRRGYRINSTRENRVYHLYYEGTYEEHVVKKYQRKKAESAAIQGVFDVELEMESVRTASSFSKQINTQIQPDFLGYSNSYQFKPSLDIFEYTKKSSSRNNLSSFDVTATSLFDLDLTSKETTAKNNAASETKKTASSEEQLDLLSLLNVTTNKKNIVANQSNLFSLLA